METLPKYVTCKEEQRQMKQQTADWRGFLPCQGKFLSLKYESTHIPSLTTPPPTPGFPLIFSRTVFKLLSRYLLFRCWLHHSNWDVKNIQSDFAIFSNPGQPSCRARDRTSKPMLPNLRASAKKVQSVSFNWESFKASGSRDANHFFFPPLSFTQMTYFYPISNIAIRETDILSLIMQAVGNQKSTIMAEDFKPKRILFFLLFYCFSLSTKQGLAWSCSKLYLFEHRWDFYYINSRKYAAKNI